MTSRDITFAAAGASTPIEYVEDVFSTFLYTGTNPTAQSINNGIDLAGEGGLVWVKSRSAIGNHEITDTARGISASSGLNTNNANAVTGADVSSFTSTGFGLTDVQGTGNTNGVRYASWTFRKAKKFFDVITYTGNGSNRTIAHNLDSVPGMIIVKRVTASGDWQVYHRSLTSAANSIKLNLQDAQASATTVWNSTAPTSTVFSVGTDATVNASGGSYVAYLFAHNAGGFGAAGIDNVISCGSFAAGTATNVELGYEPQFILVKAASNDSQWFIFDIFKGASRTGAAWLNPDAAVVEETVSAMCIPTATGFIFDGSNLGLTSGQTIIYMAIRRPMKPPTSGTEVFAPIAYTGTNVDNRLVNTGIVTDMTMARIRTATSTGGFYTAGRLRGNASLGTAITSAENTDPDSFMTPTAGFGNSFSAMNGFGVGNDLTRQLNQSSTAQLAYAFKRATGFFDEICYTGNGTSLQTFTTNLGVISELTIVRRRNSTGNWRVATLAGIGNQLILNSTAGFADPAANGIGVGVNFLELYGGADTSASGGTYVAYFFATVAGVSKVGSYTGTGDTLTINAGLPTGARFVLIKRTNAAGNWWVWDTARGMVTGTDPRLAANLTAAELNNDWVFTTTNGFQIVTTDATINASGGAYIYLAIA